MANMITPEVEIPPGMLWKGVFACSAHAVKAVFAIFKWFYLLFLLSIFFLGSLISFLLSSLSLLAKLDKADRAFCFTSGMAALAAVTHLVGTGAFPSLFLSILHTHSHIFIYLLNTAYLHF